MLLSETGICVEQTAEKQTTEIARVGAALTIRGPVTIDNVTALIESGRDQLVGAEVREVDLGGMSDVDSSAIGMLLEWQRASEAAHGVRLRFVNLPENLKSLATLYDVLDLLAADFERTQKPVP